MPKVITITAKAGTEGRLFGSVTSADVVDAIAAQAGIELDRRKLHLAEPIKTLGTHEVPAQLHPEVEFVITVEVVELVRGHESRPGRRAVQAAADASLNCGSLSQPVTHRLPQDGAHGSTASARHSSTANGVCPLATHKSVPQG